MVFRPCIDLYKGKVTQIIGGTFPMTKGARPTTNFETVRPASYFASLYRSDGLAGGHVIMLGGGNEAAARRALRAWPGGLQVGGGITARTAASYIDEGASHVIVTSWVFSGGTIRLDRLARLEQAIGAARLVLDLSCRKAGSDYIIAADRWQTASGVALYARAFGGAREPLCRVPGACR